MLFNKDNNVEQALRVLKQRDGFFIIKLKNTYFEKKKGCY